MNVMKKYAAAAILILTMTMLSACSEEENRGARA